MYKTKKSKCIGNAYHLLSGTSLFFQDFALTIKYYTKPTKYIKLFEKCDYNGILEEKIPFLGFTIIKRIGMKFHNGHELICFKLLSLIVI